MTLPLFWRRAEFSVAEAAELIGVSEVTLRTWLARCPINDRLGEKTAGRLWLSASDVFYYLLVRDFTDAGIPVRTAMLSARSMVPEDDLPRYDYLLVRRDGDITGFELVDDLPLVFDRTTIVVPIRLLAADLVDRAAVIHAQDAS